MRFASWKCIGVRRWWSVMNNATTRNLLPNSNWVNLAWCRQRFLRYSRFLLILSSALHFSRPQLFLTFSRCCRNLLFSILILYFSFFPTAISFLYAFSLISYEHISTLNFLHSFFSLFLFWIYNLFSSVFIHSFLGHTPHILPPRFYFNQISSFPFLI